MNSRQLFLFFCALAAALVSGATVPALAAPPGGASESARRLARELPSEAGQLQALREPAGTTQSQVAIALDELRQMGAPADLDPHYLPALVAAGRAFVAASGQDPLTRTTINPEYTGLEAELATSEARLDRSAGDARTVAAGIRRLEHRLADARRGVRQLQRRLHARQGP
jgi:hypothetical protein